MNLALKNNPQKYPNAVEHLKLVIALRNAKGSDGNRVGTHLQVKITDQDQERFEVPDVDQSEEATTGATLADLFLIQYPRVSQALNLKIQRKSDGKLLFQTDPNEPLMYYDQYIEWKNSLVDQADDADFFGLGERVHNFRLDNHQKDYVMWNQDKGTPVDQNLYGTHPFVLSYDRNRNRGNTFLGIFYLNANAQKVWINGHNLTYTTIGGVYDMRLYVERQAEDILKSYHATIGLPQAPPLWALAFHNCRYGYKDIDEVQKVVANYRTAAIPLETMWNDIDYMDGWRVFTLDPKNYPASKMHDFVQTLHDNDQKYVVILDPGIKVDPGYPAYDEALKRNLFIKNAQGKPLVNKVWPGYTSFTDFTLQDGQDYWVEQINKFADTLADVDGLWIDMNEIAGFCDGECYPSSSTQNDTPLTFDPVNPPFQPVQLNYKTISMNAQHSTGLEYNLHNMYGFYEAKATQASLLKRRPTEKPFVLTRSSFPGSGRYTNHWLGDNDSTYESMFYSISGVLNFQMFGIPLVGADICGFNGATTPELCARWIVLGSLGYTFTRDHNSINQPAQELYALGDEVKQIAQKAINLKLKLVPFIYSSLLSISEQGGTYLRPMLFVFPDDPEPSLAKLDRQLMLGDSIAFSPVLDQGATSVTTYLPCRSSQGNVTWYDYHDGSYVPCGWQSFGASLSDIVLHVNGGSIIPHYDFSNIHDLGRLTTKVARSQPLELLIALSSSSEASAEFYYDDGISPSKVNRARMHMGLSKKDSSLFFESSSIVLSDSRPVADHVISKFVIYGVQGRVSSISASSSSSSSPLKVVSFEQSDHVLRVIFLLTNSYLFLLPFV
eukprot:CAMPEP_0117418150 /NCGR_PEP_ID=MMETSP0758-20121206/1_1 /TAXON_ID=63605 /ORGANISM="Percolomonas cosmopolitus, Strain AE-1 (ATCC 50343)" /LENGTH=835 /DNA_ID=CAMNT_0005198505 /DNA_START=128 /DNA_END=2636 /DNA_ORIENTATION=-